MKHLFLSITAMFCLFSCDTTAQKKNDLQKENLKGKVKSVREITYDAVEKFGEITKGEIKWGRNPLYLYNDKGNLIEENSYNPDGTLSGKDKYQYDEKGNLIEKNSYNGILNSKWKYQYDEKGNLIESNSHKPDGTPYYKTQYQYTKYDQQDNWIEQIRHENNIPKEITERTIEYYD